MKIKQQINQRSIQEECSSGKSEFSQENRVTI